MHTRPAYTKIQSRVFVFSFFRSYFSQRPGAVLFAFYQCHFCRHGPLKSLSNNANTIQKIWKQNSPLCHTQIFIFMGTLFPLTALALSPSVLFRFILFLSNNLKLISTWLPEKWWTRVLGSRNASLTLHFPIQCQDNTKRNTETDTTAARDRKTYTYATENPELGIFQNRKHERCPETLTIFLSDFFFCMLKI